MTLDEAIEQFKYDAECNRADLDLSFAEDNDKVAEWLEELKQYRAIGTQDECMAAVEKQKAKKPIMKQYFEDLEDEYLCCPTCGEILTDRIPADNKTFYFHCMNCGQKFDWSDEK